MDTIATVPIFDKDGNKLFVRSQDFMGDDHEHAMKIGWGASLVECIILGMKFTGDTMEIPEELPHIPADLGGFPVAIISGPQFDAYDKTTREDE